MKRRGRGRRREGDKDRIEIEIDRMSSHEKKREGGVSVKCVCDGERDIQTSGITSSINPHVLKRRGEVEERREERREKRDGVIIKKRKWIRHFSDSL